MYLKMIALLQIMAQIGCYVPSQSAQFRISNQLFSRIGLNDNVEHGESSFAVEVKKC